MDKNKPNWFEKFTLIMDQNIRGVQYGVYSVAFVGLAVALRSVRPFKKFYRPLDILASFIEKRIKLNGNAVGIKPPSDSSPSFLLVDHSPIVSLKWVRPQTPSLPVQILSIDLTPNGVSWLQHVVVGSSVEFSVLTVDPTSARCIVTKQKKNVALDLVSLGFASVSPLDFNLEKDPIYLKYYKQLLAAENHAEKKGNGMWAKENTSPVSRLLKKVPDSMNRVNVQLLNGMRNVLSKTRKKDILPLTSGHAHTSSIAH